MPHVMMESNVALVKAALLLAKHRFGSSRGVWLVSGAQLRARIVAAIRMRVSMRPRVPAHDLQKSVNNCCAS